MKYTIEQIPEGENEVIVRYCHMTPEVEQLLNNLQFVHRKLIGFRDGLQVVINRSQILYIESVDGRTFASYRGHTQVSTAALVTSISFSLG